MIIDSIRKFILTCPFLNESSDGGIRLNVNYLGKDSTVYSLEEIPCDPIIKQYIDGSTIRQCQFTFCSREPYGADIMQNISNSGFYEDFANWIEGENKLPVLNDGYESQELKVLSPGYAFQVSEDKARYQIDLRLKYYKKLGGN
jgi:hypothetical protein